MRKAVTVLRDVVRSAVGRNGGDEEIGTLFRIARETARLSMGTVARRVGCDVSKIADYEHGRDRPVSWSRLFMHLESEPGNPSFNAPPPLSEESMFSLFTVLVMKLGNEVEITYADLRKALVDRVFLHRFDDPSTGAIKYRVSSRTP